MKKNRPKQCNVFLVEGQTRATQPFYKNQKNLKTESSPSLFEKTPRSPHQSRAPYSFLSFHSGFLYQNPCSYESRREEGATKERRHPCHGGKGSHLVQAQNLPKLDKLISYIQASIIHQYRLKHIDKDSNTIKKNTKKNRKHRWKHLKKIPREWWAKDEHK